MQRYVLILEYKGTNFSGSQKQKTKVRTVQGELEKAISTLTKQFSQAEQMQEFIQEDRQFISIAKLILPIRKCFIP
ncbi:MAG: hypothetical protein Q4E87_03890 [bacterium]|nr:hypothetical protein [bacterium]